MVTDDSKRPLDGILHPQAELALLTLQAHLSICNEAFGPLRIHARELLSSDSCCSKATLHRVLEHEHAEHLYARLDPAGQVNLLSETDVSHARSTVQVSSRVQ